MQVNRPAIIMGAFVIALLLGSTHRPEIQYLRPVGEFYVALLQMCVLPFLLATIPLSVRSAMLSNTAGNVAGRLAVWLFATVAIVSLLGIFVSNAIFYVMPIDPGTLAKIGALVGDSAHRVDVEFALDPERTGMLVAPVETGLLALIPTNVFAALASNDSVRVLVFAAIFGIGMVFSEKRSGQSVFGALSHIQEVCVLIFEWFSVFMPLGIIVLIAPQVALLGTEAYAVLALFSYAFLIVSALVLLGALLVVSAALHKPLGMVTSSMLKPMVLGAATRNTLVCIPAALETMTKDLAVKREPCELYLPIGFAAIRFGTIIYFAVAAIFMGTLLGRSFSPGDIVAVAALSVVASVGTIGLSGPAALAPLAAVLRPFGLSYELAVPLLIVLEPIANMIRVVLNVAVNCVVPALAVGTLRGQPGDPVVATK